MSQPNLSENLPREIAEILWAFHDARLADPSIKEMQPYIQPMLQLLRQAMEEVLGPDDKQVWDDEFYMCQRCEFEPSDDTRTCICIYKNNLRSEQRQRIENIMGRES